MPEASSNTFALIIFVFWLFILILIAARVIRSKCAVVKTVKAVVIDKCQIEAFSKYSGNGKKTKYAIVFSAEGRKLSFYVSEFSYGGYSLKESGTLKYKGDRIIAFKK